jgi:4-hydroxy-3-polyprenylbenzoate decarboxylase
LILESRLKKCGVPEVKGVYEHQITQNYFVAVAIKQRYEGHAKQAGLQLTSLLNGGRYVIVVDEDVDITDLQEVLWAVCTRSNPMRDINVVSGLPASNLDPIFRKGEKDRIGSKVLIIACRPYAWRNEFPEVISFSPELVKGMREKWAGVLDL